MSVVLPFAKVPANRPVALLREPQQAGARPAPYRPRKFLQNNYLAEASYAPPVGTRDPSPPSILEKRQSMIKASWLVTVAPLDMGLARPYRFRGLEKSSMKAFSVSTEATFAAASRKAVPCKSMRSVTTAKALPSRLTFILGVKLLRKRSRLV